MLLDHRSHFLNIFVVVQTIETHHILIAMVCEISCFIENVSDPPRHSGGKVTTGWTKDDDTPTRHVFATMVTHRFNYGMDTTISNTKPLARHAANISLTICRSIKCDVPDNNVFFRQKC